MKTVDIFIIVFIAFIALALIYNRYIKLKKAKEKGISPGCCGCRYSYQCTKNKAYGHTNESACSTDSTHCDKSSCTNKNDSNCSCC